MPRVASLVLIGGALIVLLGAIFSQYRGLNGLFTERTEIHNPSEDLPGSIIRRSVQGHDPGRHREVMAGPLSAAWIVIGLTLSAVSFEILTTVSASTVSIWGHTTTPIRYVASHWLAAGVAAVGLFGAYYHGQELHRWSVRLSTSFAIISLGVAVYELFVVLPNL